MKNLDPRKSATYCGCDEAETYTCERHSVALTEAFHKAWANRPECDVIIAKDQGKHAGTPMEVKSIVPSAAAPATNSPEWRKQRPLWSGVMRYFPDALLEVAHVSWVGNEQHNPGSELHWDRSKSTDDGDACARHLTQAGTFDNDGTRHSAKAAWRALALLQKELENEQG